MERLLEVKSCSYTEKYNFTVEDGSLVVIVGPNGSGKTTFLKNISGALRPALCEVYLDGTRIAELDTQEVVRRGIVLVPEGKANFPQLTVMENITLGFYTAGIPKKERPVILGAIFKIFPVLRERGNQLAGSLSGGEQRMLAIARGLASNPKVLLLDEPSLGLAPKAIDKIYSSIIRIKGEGKSIIIAEQGISTVLAYKEYIDKVYFLLNHKFVFCGSSEELEDIEIEEVRRVYFGVQESK